jgi:hypothetical protein
MARASQLIVGIAPIAVIMKKTRRGARYSDQQNYRFVLMTIIGTILPYSCPYSTSESADPIVEDG